ncbi:MAG: pyridoxamine 5'-phosphate oxidase family protein [Chloroflexi bacterium]|nr:pyridoxamine 5'-phosphate oxidase family protein [Chloroflexota bacterium]
MSKDATLPNRLAQILQRGTPAILATYGSDGWPNAVMTWAISGDPRHVRFGVDLGSATLANIQREGKASLQIIGQDNVLFLIKGTAHVIKEHIDALPAPHLMCIMEMTPHSVKDQSWVGVEVAPLAYRWVGHEAEKMAEAERTALVEMRDWESR